MWESIPPSSPMLNEATFLVRYMEDRKFLDGQYFLGISLMLPQALWSLGKHSKLQARSFMKAPLSRIVILP